MENIVFTFPFTKVDKKRRVVVGYATADNIDPADDLVEFDASKEAFQEWRGNIREMHQPKSVGKSLSWSPVKVPYEGQLYDGIEVEAYISKGAEDTWQKILDGTLRGFSVGGDILKKAYEFNKSTNRTVRRIKKYSLGELSLVDNPGNPAAMISLVKRASDGTLEYSLEKTITADVTEDKNPAIIDDRIVESKKKKEKKMSKVTNSHGSPPKGYPSDKSQYADPGNYKYPVDTLDRADAAMKYYNHDGEQSAGGYDDDQWHSIGARIVEALNRLSDNKYVLQGGKIAMKSDNDADDVQKLQNNNSDDIVKSMDTAEKRTLMDKFKALLGLEDEPVQKIDVTNGTQTYTFTANTESGFTGFAPTITFGNTSGTVVVDENKEEAEAVTKSATVVEDEVTETTENSSDEDEGGKEELDTEALKELLGSLLDEKLTKIKEEVSASVDEKLETITKSVETVTEKVETVEKAGAIKKSVDENVDDSEDVEDEKITKRAESKWGGMFVPAEICEALGYSS